MKACEITGIKQSSNYQMCVIENTPEKPLKQVSVVFKRSYQIHLLFYDKFKSFTPKFRSYIKVTSICPHEIIHNTKTEMICCKKHDRELISFHQRTKSTS